MSAQGHECGSRARSSNFPERVDFSRSDANDWMATSGLEEVVKANTSV
jgi:hypothetical protein